MTPVVPKEILSQIARACVEEAFCITFRSTKTAVTKGLTRSLTGKRLVYARRLCFDGVPNLIEIKLVNSFFYHEVWTAIRHNFDGCMELNLYGSLGNAIVDYANKTLHSTGKLSWLLPKIRHIKLFSHPECRLLPSLQLHRFPNLRVVHLGKVSQVRENGRRTGEKAEIMAGSMDDVIIRAFRQDAQATADAFAELEKFQAGRIRFLLEYTFSVVKDGDTAASCEFDLDVTDPRDVTVASRRWVPYDTGRYLRFIP